MDKHGICLEIVNEAFVRVALDLGKISESYNIPDGAVWDLAEAIDLSCGRVLTELSDLEVTTGLDEGPYEAYGPPAVAQLLKRLEDRLSSFEGKKEDDDGMD